MLGVMSTVSVSWIQMTLGRQSMWTGIYSDKQCDRRREALGTCGEFVMGHIAWQTLLWLLWLSCCSGNSNKIGHPMMKSSAARNESSSELQWLDVKINHWDSSFSNGGWHALSVTFGWVVYETNAFRCCKIDQRESWFLHNSTDHGWTPSQRPVMWKVFPCHDVIMFRILHIC